MSSVVAALRAAPLWRIAEASHAARLSNAALIMMGDVVSPREELSQVFLVLAIVKILGMASRLRAWAGRSAPFSLLRTLRAKA